MAALSVGEGAWAGLVVGLILLLGAALAFGPVLAQAGRARRRARWMSEPFPALWEKWLQERWKIYRSLPEEVRAGVRQRVAVLVREKRFEACGGLERITDEMRVLVLAQASLLLLVPGCRDFFPRLRSILIYPGAFRDQARRRFGRPEEEEERDRGTLLGESWSSGSLILSWDSVKRSAWGDPDGINVVLHEFAHQLDLDDGSTDGVPGLGSLEDSQRWAEVFQRRFDQMTSQLAEGREPVLDEYGATDPPEFFAVATEAFFETPRRLKREMGDLYEELRRYYGVDPARW